MTAATQGRNTQRRIATCVGHPVQTGTTIHAGTVFALLLASGNAVPAGTAGTGNAVGVAKSSVTGDGSSLVEGLRGDAFHLANSSGADAISRADIGELAFVVDDQTVAKGDNEGARKIAGKVIDVDAVGVWVVVG